MGVARRIVASFLAAVAITVDASSGLGELEHFSGMQPEVQADAAAKEQKEAQDKLAHLKEVAADTEKAKAVAAQKKSKAEVDEVNAQTVAEAKAKAAREAVASAMKRRAQEACDETLSGTNGDGYRGCQTKTDDGRVCVKWTQAGWVVDTTLGIGDHNYCRNPYADEAIWCWTSTDARQYGFCSPLNPLVSCTVDSLTCAIPAEVSHLDFVVLDALDEDDSMCNSYDHAHPAELSLSLSCSGVSKTTSTDGSSAQWRATLAEKRTPRLQGGKRKMIECTCTTTLLRIAGGQVSYGDVTITDRHDHHDVDGAGGLGEASITAFEDAQYKTSIEAGGVLPSTASRIYYEVTVQDSTGPVGLISCSAAPSNNPNDPSMHDFLKESCTIGNVDYQSLPIDSPNVFRFSTLPFKFVAKAEVHITCTLMQCASSESQSCGRCQQSTRRLSGVAAEYRGFTTASFTGNVPNVGKGMVLLPNKVTGQVSLMEDPGVPESVAGVVAANVTLYAIDVGNVSELARTVADTTAKWLGYPVASTRAVSVYASPATSVGRRLLPVSFMEAITVQVQVIPQTSTADVVRQLEQASAERGTEFSRMLKEEIIRLGNTPAVHFRTEWGAPRVVQDGTLAQPSPGESPSEITRDPAFVTAIVATVAIITALVCIGAVYRCTQRRRAARHGKDVGGGTAGDSKMRKEGMWL